MLRPDASPNDEEDTKQPIPRTQCQEPGTGQSSEVRDHTSHSNSHGSCSDAGSPPRQQRPLLGIARTATYRHTIKLDRSRTLDRREGKLNCLPCNSAGNRGHKATVPSQQLVQDEERRRQSGQEA